MSTMTPAELLNLWKQEQVTVEMTTGHTLQNLVKQQAAIESLTVLLGKLRADVDQLIAAAGAQEQQRMQKATNV
ncbi:MAG: hypothetical protein U0350_16525 [Caldilineaceae bacterium]